MHRFDPDLIAALAEGRLPAEEAAALEAEIASDPAALAELEAQRTALVALASLPAATLTDSERGGLRSAVSGELGLAPTVESATPRQIPWAAIGIAAATLAAIVAVVPIVGLLSTDADPSTATFQLANADTSTTGATNEVAATAQDGEDSTEDVSAGGADTTAAAESTTTVVPNELQRAGTEFALVEALAFVKSDPGSLDELSTPTDDETPCVSEAEHSLDAEGLRYFEYHQGSGDDDEATTTSSSTTSSSTSTTSTTAEGTSATTTTTQPTTTTTVVEEPTGPVFFVFFVPHEDPEQAGPFVAFSPDDCGTPYKVP